MCDVGLGEERREEKKRGEKRRKETKSIVGSVNVVIHLLVFKHVYFNYFIMVHS